MSKTHSGRDNGEGYVAMSSCGLHINRRRLSNKPSCQRCQFIDAAAERRRAQTREAVSVKGARPAAWVEIHGAKLYCPCGVVTDFTDHVRQEFLSNPEHKCEECGTVWGTPATADCELVGKYNGPAIADEETPR
jgi:hypothetical protein